MKKIFMDLNQAAELENRRRLKEGTFVDRIIENNGNLEFFLEENNE